MHTPITYILLRLEGEGEITRKQLRDWTGKSLSYVDQRMQGHTDWAGEDVDRIIQRGFELEIPPLMNRYLGDKVILDLEYMSHMIDGDILQELKALQQTMGQIIDNWDAERNDGDCREVCKKGVRLFATIQTEFEQR